MSTKTEQGVVLIFLMSFLGICIFIGSFFYFPKAWAKEITPLTIHSIPTWIYIVYSSGALIIAFLQRKSKNDFIIGGFAGMFLGILYGSSFSFNLGLNTLASYQGPLFLLAMLMGVVTIIVMVVATVICAMLFAALFNNITR